MSTSATPQRLTDRKRLAILDAAVAEFRSSGFEATSMDKIAASAGVSKRTVYNHFPSKDELFMHILEQLWERSVALMDLPYQKDQPLRPQLMALMQQKMQLLGDTSFLDLARVAIAETIHSPERAHAIVERMNSREEGVTAWIRAALADGRLKQTDPLLASHMLQGQLKTLAFWPQVTMGQPPLDETSRQAIVVVAVDMFLGYYAADAKA